MGLRKRPHRRANCSTSQKITMAYYFLTQDLSDSDKLGMVMDHPNLVGVDRAYSDNRFLFLFNDESVLGFDEVNKFYLADTWGRNRPDAGPSKIGTHARKKIYVD